VSQGIVSFLNTFIFIYSWLIIARVLMTWIPSGNATFQSIFSFLYQVTEPYLGLFRRIIPTIGGGGVGIDISPIVALLVLQLVQRLLIGVL
jgi:uncharacterized protein YggT (Ycf19 family)